MTTKQLNLWKSEAVQITGRAEQVHEWRALPPLLLPQLSFSVFCVFLLCNAKSTFLCCCCCVLGEVEGQDRAGYQLEGIAPFLCPFCNFFFISVGCCCYCCCCVSGEVAEQRASWRALPSPCVPLQLSFSQPQPADRLWIYLLWDQLQKISTH